MSVILITGPPLSGKTGVAKVLKTHFENLSRKVLIISDDDDYSRKERNSIYNDTAAEKNMRASLKSKVERELKKDTILIFDALNYIKGYRYQVYCDSKNARLKMCTIFCIVSDSESAKRNSVLEEDDRYDESTLTALFMRFEPPDANNRWDKPLFLVSSKDSIPMDEIEATVFEKKAVLPNQSTQFQPISDTDYVKELDDILKRIVNCILEQQKFGSSGEINLADEGIVIRLKKKLVIGELAKIRRQFLSYVKSRPVGSLPLKEIPKLFEEFLQSRIDCSA